MQLNDESKTVINLNNVNFVEGERRSYFCQVEGKNKSEYWLIIHSIGNNGYAFTYSDKKVREKDRKEIIKWMDKKEQI